MLIRRFGREVGGVLKRRLADLRASASIRDVVLGNIREMPGTSGRTMHLDLGDGFRLVLEANHTNYTFSDDGRVDWSEVNRVKIIAVERADD